MSLRIAGLFAHPDDEAYSVGGSLARWADAGARVQLLCATRGEGGGDPSVREGELRDACAVLGLDPPAVLGWPDGGVAALPRAQALRELTAVLDPLSPHAVVTLGPDGAYGHSDHLACTALLGEAAARIEPVPRVLHAAFPRGTFARVHRLLRQQLGVAGVPLEASALGVAPGDVHAEVDIRAVADRKRRAVLAHRSQLRSEDPPVFLVPGLLEQLLTVERFQVAAGPPLPPGERDPLAGLGEG
jgi:N-acetyl-1-D-myo-inositol-2-amino-2-deoxy-alpha-D-glucopyranoside deacetylase